MSEDLVELAGREHARSYADLQYTAERTLGLYERLCQDEDWTDDEIRAVIAQAPAAGSTAVGLFLRLTRDGASVEAAAEVATQAAAAVVMRQQAGAGEQAEEVFDAVGTFADNVAAGRVESTAMADFREAIVGWRGEGRAEGPLAEPVLVAFDDGTVVPDGVELAGIRETGARHSIVAPQVQAGIDAYLAARAEGVEHLAALELAGNGPGVYGAVAQFADDVERDELDLTTARDAAVASITADAAIGQFLSLRNAGMHTDQAAATAAGGNPVAVHAIAGFIGRVRDGAAEDVAEVDAWAGAVSAVRQREDYRGPIPEGIDLPGFDAARTRARAALDAHHAGAAAAEQDEVDAEAVRRYESLTRLGMDPEAASRLAAADSAAQQARIQAHNEFRVLHEAETVLDGVRGDTDAAGDYAADHDRTSGEKERGADELAPLGEAVAESGQAVDAAAAAAAHAETAHEDDDTERAARCARWNIDDQAADAADDDTKGWQQ